MKPSTDAGSPPTGLVRASDVAWRGLVVALAIAVIVYVLVAIRFVALPVFIAMLVAAALVPLVGALERRRWPTLLATWTVFGGFVLALVGLSFVVIPAMVDEFKGLGETIARGVDDFEQWLVEGPTSLDREQIDRYREDAGQYVERFLRSSGGHVVFAVAEGIAGVILSIVLSFFFIKDGRRFQTWTLAHVPPRHHELTTALAGRAWSALGAYLRGAAALGGVEAVIIGITLWLVGADLIIPVVILTFLGGFFPIVGAVVAGVIASLVALVSGGPADAAIVGLVALAVQQLDNDLLAPLIYGRIVRLHPVTILIALAVGGTTAGIAGAFLAVPVVAVAGAVIGELWARYGEEWRAEAAV